MNTLSPDGRQTIGFWPPRSSMVNALRPWREPDNGGPIRVQPFRRHRGDQAHFRRPASFRAHFAGETRDQKTSGDHVATTRRINVQCEHRYGNQLVFRLRLRTIANQPDRPTRKAGDKLDGGPRRDASCLCLDQGQGTVPSKRVERTSSGRPPWAARFSFLERNRQARNRSKSTAPTVLWRRSARPYSRSARPYSS